MESQGCIGFLFFRSWRNGRSRYGSSMRIMSRMFQDARRMLQIANGFSTCTLAACCADRFGRMILSARSDPYGATATILLHSRPSIAAHAEITGSDACATTSRHQ
jgi:hypothetical protein